MMMDDFDGQMIFGDLEGLKLPDIRLTGEENPRKNLTQETYPDRESNPGPLRDRSACYRFFHSGPLTGTVRRGYFAPTRFTLHQNLRMFNLHLLSKILTKLKSFCYLRSELLISDYI